DLVGDVARLARREREPPAQQRGVQVRAGGLYADAAFFRVFSFPLAQGDPATALRDPFAVVLSPAAAERFFGRADPMGRAITTESGDTYTVTGVFAPFPGKTHLPLEAVASISTVAALWDEPDDPARWAEGISESYAYLVLDEGAEADAVEARLNGLIASRFPTYDGEALHGMTLQSITRINLGPFLDNNLGMPMPWFVGLFLGALALVVMVVACLNYAGLAVARGLSRAREVGVRKVMGAHRRQIVAQFIVEAALVVGLSTVVGAVLLAWIAPAFNQLLMARVFGASVTTGALADAGVYAAVLGFVVLVAVVAGLYPALYLSSAATSESLRGLGGLRRFGGQWLRKSLTVGQFSFALVLVVSTVLLYRQAAFLLAADPGFDQQRVVTVALQDVPYPVVREAALGTPGVERVSGTSLLPVAEGRRDTWLSTPGMDEPWKGYSYAIDEHFVGALGLDLVAGRNLSPEAGTAGGDAVLLNETALAPLGLGDARAAVGQEIVLGDSTRVTVAGVVRDYQTNPGGQEVSPVVLTYTPADFQWALLRVRPGDEARVRAALARRWPTLGSARPVRTDVLAAQVAGEPTNIIFSDVQRVVGFIATLALVIAFLGLLSLAAYTTRRRTKEVGIRKTLGARTMDVVLLLSREFVVLLGIAVAVAVPATWLLSRTWLGLFAQRITLSPAPFIAGVLLVVGLALLAVGSQAWRADRADPVDALRYE
ncbi:MAG TPA: FtsX-like permease family protein, partial [Rhodothermales bacterium]|nr:FtsX-like permease family protein [Rhodothermales bacterium]